MSFNRSVSACFPTGGLAPEILNRGGDTLGMSLRSMRPKTEKSRSHRSSSRSSRRPSTRARKLQESVRGSVIFQNLGSEGSHFKPPSEKDLMMLTKQHKKRNKRVGVKVHEMDPKCHWLEHHRGALYKGWTGLGPLPEKGAVKKVYKSMMPDAKVLQKSKVASIIHGAPIKWRSHNTENIWDYEGMSMDDLDSAMENRIKLMDGSFSKFQSEALLKNVNLKAHNHLANLTDSPGWIARNDG